MIVPRLRLIFLTAVLLLPLSLLAAKEASWGVTAIGIAGLLLLLAIVDAALSHRRFEGISVTAADIFRMTVGRSGRISLIVGKPSKARLRLRIGLALPEKVACKDKIQTIELGFDSEKAQVVWHCRALARGHYELSACHVEMSSHLKLWDVRRRFEMAGEIRAYPNLVSGQKNILGLFDRSQWGMRYLREIGKGREFEQLREYLPGDSYEDIDWKATARRRYPVTRVYQVERSQEIYVVLDASRLSTRSALFSRDRRQLDRSEAFLVQDTIFERYVTAALIMALAADQAADRYGLLIFGAYPDCIIKAGRGRAHYNACREALYNRMPQTVSPDFDELFTFIGTHLRKRALLVFLTSLDDPLIAETFVDAMRVCAQRHLLMVNMLRPEGAYPLFSSPEVHHPRGIYEHLAGHMLWSSLNESRRRLRRQGVDFALLDPEHLCSQLVSQYMEIKQRQIL